MIQSWVPSILLDNPSNLAFPTWVALRNLPFEHNDEALAIIETLREVVGIDMSNKMERDSRFFANLMVDKGWVTNIDLKPKDGISPSQSVMVDYDKVLIRCKACHSWKYKI